MQTRPATNASYWQIVAARPPPPDPMPLRASSAGENEREPTEILIYPCAYGGWDFGAPMKRK
jgi:hypothetical protein